MSSARQPSPWIDVSVRLRSGMVHYPGDPPVCIERITDIERGDSHTLSRLDMGAHSGTHVDAPRHFLRAGAGVDEMPPEIAAGQARVIEIADPVSIKPAELEHYGIRRGERILFKTLNSTYAWARDEFVEDFVYLTAEAADYLALRQVRLVGIDYLSIGPFHGDGARVHRTLLGAGAWIVEGLDLSAVTAGCYEFICLPLRIQDGDGAPARAVLRRLG